MVSPAVRVLKKRKGGHFDRRKMDWATMVKKYGLGIKRRSFRAILESDFRSPVPNLRGFQGPMEPSELHKGCLEPS